MVYITCVTTLFASIKMNYCKRGLRVAHKAKFSSSLFKRYQGASEVLTAKSEGGELADKHCKSHLDFKGKKPSSGPSRAGGHAGGRLSVQASILRRVSGH